MDTIDPEVLQELAEKNDSMVVVGFSEEGSGQVAILGVDTEQREVVSSIIGAVMAVATDMLMQLANEGRLEGSEIPAKASTTTQ